MSASKRTSSTPERLAIAEAGPASPMTLAVWPAVFPRDSQIPDIRPIVNKKGENSTFIQYTIEPTNIIPLTTSYALNEMFVGLNLCFRSS